MSELSGGPKQRSFEKLDVRGRQSVVSKGRGAKGVRSVVSGAGRLGLGFFLDYSLTMKYSSEAGEI